MHLCKACTKFSSSGLSAIFARDKKRKGSMQDDQAFLQHQLRELRNSILHLERSNKELHDAVRDAPDPELATAIEENVSTIRKLGIRAEEITQLLRAMGASTHDSPATENPLRTTSSGEQNLRPPTVHHTP